MNVVDLEQRRFYLKTHHELDPRFCYYPSELDRIYGAVTVYDRETDTEAVVCPICGWMSRPYKVKITFRQDARVLYFSRIASILMRHLKKAHDICERKEKGGRIYGIASRAIYRCKICGSEQDGVIEILSHYLATHFQPECVTPVT